MRRSALLAVLCGIVLCGCGKEGECPDPWLKRRNTFAICQDIYAPICGCDGKTYGNECEARVAGIRVAFEGECDPQVPVDQGMQKQ